MATATPPTPGATTGTAEPTKLERVAPPPPHPDEDPPPDPNSLAGRLAAFRGRHAKLEIAVFFSVGFIFDLITLDRIDSWLTLIQQFVYLSLLGSMLLLEQRHALGLWRPTGVVRKAWRFHEDGMHFFFGSLLSSYTLFYFKSSSGIQAVGFMLALIGLLLINELPRFRKLGPLMRFALFSLCLASYLAYLLPVLIGHVTVWLFSLAMLLGAGVMVLLYKRIEKWAAQTPAAVTPSSASSPAVSPNVRGRRLLIVALSVQAVFFGLYVSRALPPVPLSASYIGIFHHVSKSPDNKGYLLEYEKPTWKFWHRGDQDFRARAGDVIYVFARVFTPRSYSDPLFFKWSFDDPKRGWTSHGRAALPVRAPGQRDDGYAIYATKANYQPGDWKVEIQTRDERDIAELHFKVFADDRTDARVFAVEKR